MITIEPIFTGFAMSCALYALSMLAVIVYQEMRRDKRGGSACRDAWHGEGL